MQTVKVDNLLHKRALITRESARVISGALSTAMAMDGGEVALDFSGVDAVTPSFVDELLAVVDEILTEREWASFRVLFLNPPTRLSAKFAAVGRARGLQIAESLEGAWTITAGTARELR